MKMALAPILMPRLDLSWRLVNQTKWGSINPSIQYAYRLSNDQHTNSYPLTLTLRNKHKTKLNMCWSWISKLSHEYRGNYSPLTPQVDTHQLRVNYKGLDIRHRNKISNWVWLTVIQWGGLPQTCHFKIWIWRTLQWDGKTPRYHWKFYNGYISSIKVTLLLIINGQSSTITCISPRWCRQIKTWRISSVGAMHFIKHGNFTTGIKKTLAKMVFQNSTICPSPELDLRCVYQSRWKVLSFPYDFKDYIKGLKITYKYITHFRPWTKMILSKKVTCWRPKCLD